MPDSVRNLQEDALKLSEKQRAELARMLLLSLDEPEDQATEQVWAEEAERRYQELKSGAVEAIPSDEVFSEVRARLR